MSPAFWAPRLAATINQLSNFIRTGSFGKVSTPIVLGNEGSGEIEAGSRFPRGAGVAIYGGNKLGITEDGLFQRFALVENRRLIKLPDSLDWSEGGPAERQLSHCISALTHVAGIKEGESMVVSGATGSVGSAVVQVASALGAKPIALVSGAEKTERNSCRGSCGDRHLSGQGCSGLSAQADWRARRRLRVRSCRWRYAEHASPLADDLHLQGTEMMTLGVLARTPRGRVEVL